MLNAINKIPTFIQIPLGLGLTCFICFVCLFATSVAIGDNDQTPTRVDSGSSQTQQSESSSESSNEVSETKSFAIGDAIAVGSYKIQVVEAEIPYTPSDSLFSPSSGNMYIAVEVLYENISDEKISYNSVFDWKFSDSEGYSYQPTLAVKAPGLSSGDLMPGKKVRGWITVEVSKESQDLVANFIPWLSGYDATEIKLN